MAHDFKNFPELTNRQLAIYYFDSPHRQIKEGFMAKVVKVTDGDTIRVECDFRDFDFPIRLSHIAAPEINEEGGEEARNWLEEKIMGEEVYIKVDLKNRVGKWGRLLGEIIHHGVNLNEQAIQLNYAIKWEDREKKAIPDFGRFLKNVKWH